MVRARVRRLMENTAARCVEAYNLPERVTAFAGG